ncbi:hypothetical protein LUS53_25965 [Escherichia coli]|uniref:hypothetical protein n=1 Tax=Escherichia coli TaxID=562 RepID=UPI001E55AE58|nr:hypothetical protein [Escherichia coli]MCD9370886.1 hypothetical protein [Escherichia coli]MCD9390349.1 hypothetical protein [Escherichia coli]
MEEMKLKKIDMEKCFELGLLDRNDYLNFLSKVKESKLKQKNKLNPEELEILKEIEKILNKNKA